MIIRAVHKNARISAQKARLVADIIRDKKAYEAVNVLKFTQKKAARLILRVLNSAIANAENNAELDIDDLVVKSVHVEKATSMKRFSARAKGRGNRIEKQTCHIYVSVSDGLSKE